MPTGSLGLEGIVSKTPGVAVQVRRLARLAQVQEPGCAGWKREAEEDLKWTR